MNYLKNIIGGMERPSENYSIAEQAKPALESRYEENNLVSSNNIRQTSNNKNKKTRKVATIIRPRRIMVQKTPKSIKKRVTNLENTVSNYGSKINNYIEDSKKEKEEFTYIPITFRIMYPINIDNTENAYGLDPIFMVRTNTRIINFDSVTNREHGKWCDIDAILQLKNLEKILISKRATVPTLFIYKGTYSLNNSIDNFKEIFNNNGIEIEYY